MPDSCKVLIVRSLVREDLERELLKVHPTANYKATKEYILEQASLKGDAHFDDKGKQDKLVFVEVDALLAKVSAFKDARRSQKLGQIRRRTLLTKLNTR